MAAIEHGSRNLGRHFRTPVALLAACNATSVIARLDSKSLVLVASYLVHHRKNNVPRLWKYSKVRFNLTKITTYLSSAKEWWTTFVLKLGASVMIFTVTHFARDAIRIVLVGSYIGHDLLDHQLRWDATHAATMVKLKPFVFV